MNRSFTLIKWQITVRSVILVGLLLAINAVLIYKFAPELKFITTWLPDDFQKYFLPWGLDARRGIYNYHYPLPTLLWVFVPISFLPPGWVLVWVAMPFVFLLYLFGRKGVILWLSFPFLDHAAYGQMDGWLLLPLAWLFDNHPILGGVSAALLTFKPQLGLFPVAYMFFRWIVEHNWRALGIFGASMLVLYVPSFILDPGWVFKFISYFPERTAEPTLVTRGSSLWAMWWHGGWTLWLLPLAIIVVVLFFIRAVRTDWKRVRALHLLGLMALPVFYPVSFVTIAPTLKNSTRHLFAFTIVSWIAALFDILTQGWGGSYVIIPIVALVMLALDPAPFPTLFPAPLASSDPAPQNKLGAQE